MPALDVVEEGRPRLLAGGPQRVGDKLALERGEKDIGHDVVRAVVFAAQAGDSVVVGEALQIDGR